MPEDCKYSRALRAERVKKAFIKVCEDVNRSVIGFKNACARLGECMKKNKDIKTKC